MSSEDWEKSHLWEMQSPLWKYIIKVTENLSS